MTIKVAPRPDISKKTLICQGSEACTSKFRISRGILVERFQDYNGEPTNHIFFLSSSPGYDLVVSPGDRRYYLLKYQSLRLARVLFPKHFVNMNFMHLFDESCAMYSDFVPDDSGALKRAIRARKRYDASEDPGERISILEEFARNERQINQELVPLIKIIENAGISVGHPEANYHVRNGNTILFEIDGIDLPRLLSHLVDYAGTWKEDPLHHISLIIACQLKLLANVPISSLGAYYNDGFCPSFQSSSLKDVCDLVQFYLSRSLEKEVPVFESGPISFINLWAHTLSNHSYPRGMFKSPYYVDEEVFQPSK
jgi:hypothetical protein